jgi:hypothetical protein
MLLADMIAKMWLNERMNGVQRSGRMVLKGEYWNPLRKPCPQYHFVHHKSHCRKIDFRPLRRLTSSFTARSLLSSVPALTLLYLLSIYVPVGLWQQIIVLISTLDCHLPHEPACRNQALCLVSSVGQILDDRNSISWAALGNKSNTSDVAPSVTEADIGKDNQSNKY